MKFVDFTKEVDSVHKASNNRWTKGQTMFNIFAHHFFEEAKKIVHSKLDPTYDDENIPAFLEAVKHLFES